MINYAELIANTDGDCSTLPGLNPSCDQDRQRIDTCKPASYSYGGASAKEAEHETDAATGY